MWLCRASDDCVFKVVLDDGTLRFFRAECRDVRSTCPKGCNYRNPRTGGPPLREIQIARCGVERLFSFSLFFLSLGIIILTIERHRFVAKDKLERFWTFLVTWINNIDRIGRVEISPLNYLSYASMLPFVLPLRRLLVYFNVIRVYVHPGCNDEKFGLLLT